MSLRRGWGLLAVLWLCATAAQAADLRLLPDNPFRAQPQAILDLDPRYSEALEFSWGFDWPDDLEALAATWRWVFDGGINSDGAHTYETLHIPAAWGSLMAGRVIELTGHIRPGDADRLRAILDENRLSRCLSPGYCPFSNVISLNSPGGSFGEALDLAELIRAENMVTVIPEGARCESACALVFLAGYTDYEGYFFPRRFAHVSARLGLHQPTLALPERDYSAGEVTRILDLLGQSMNAVSGFCVRAGVSLGLLEAMYATGPDAMYRAGPMELAAEGIFVFAGRDRGARLEWGREAALS